MPTDTYKEVLQQTEGLSRQQCLLLIEQLVHRLNIADNATNESINWESCSGTAPYPLCGEDAQDWVSRSRRENIEARDFQ